MSNLDKFAQQWEHLYTQFKGSNGDPVLCMVNKQTNKFAYLDVKLNRVLSKQEALNYRVDVTGFHVIYSEATRV
jgi:hypothetical protein